MIFNPSPLSLSPNSHDDRTQKMEIFGYVSAKVVNFLYRETMK